MDKNLKIAASIIISVVIIVAVAIMMFQQGQPSFSATRTANPIKVDNENLGNFIYFEVIFHLKYDGNTPLTNVYIYIDKKVMTVPIIESGWTLKYTDYYYTESLGTSSIKIVWNGGEQTLTVK